MNCVRQMVRKLREATRILTGLLEGHGTEVMREAQDPERGAQRLIRMGTPVHLLAQQRGGRGAYGLGAFQEPLVDSWAMDLKVATPLPIQAN